MDIGTHSAIVLANGPSIAHSPTPENRTAITHEATNMTSHTNASASENGQTQSRHQMQTAGFKSNHSGEVKEFPTAALAEILSDAVFCSFGVPSAVSLAVVFPDAPFFSPGKFI